MEVVDKLGELVENLHDWEDLYKRLKGLEDNQILPGQTTVQQEGSTLDKYIRDVKKSLKEAFDDLIVKI